VNPTVIENPRIAVVFATMDRSATAVGCLIALAAQTRPPQLVVIADNCSTDGTVEALGEIDDLPFEFILHRMAANKGNAGGVEEAMEIAFGKGVDAVWILDDDSWPRARALEAMLSEPYDGTIALHPVQLDPKSGRFTWPLRIKTDGGWRLAFSLEEMPGGFRTASRGVWTGVLVSRRIRETIGPVLGELFIRGEDEEYPWRMEQAGISHSAVHSAILDHPGPTDIVHWSFLGKHFFFERGLADWKLHYKVRNMVWLKKRQSGAVKSLLVFATYVVAVCRFDGFRKIPLLLTAFGDGWNGKLGKI